MKEMKNGNAGVMIEHIEATSCFLVPTYLRMEHHKYRTVPNASQT